MKTNLLYLLPGLLVLFLSMNSCAPVSNPSTPPEADSISTIVAATLQAMTTSPQEPTAIQVSFTGTTFNIPGGLASGALSEIVPESIGTDLPFWEIHPAYTKFTLQDYPLQGRFFEPQIHVYPVREYAQMNDGAAMIISNLQMLMNSQGTPLPDHLPFLPPFNAEQVLYAQEKSLQFQNGVGMRFLTQYGQAPDPINNHELFYTYQGMTDEGTYYISAILPVSATFLPENGNPDSPLPPDGVPFDWENFNNLGIYLDQARGKLNAADSNTFTPSLSRLDEMLQSLLVTVQ
jgi:hypothetical protein